MKRVRYVYNLNPIGKDRMGVINPHCISDPSLYCVIFDALGGYKPERCGGWHVDRKAVEEVVDDVRPTPVIDQILAAPMPAIPTFVPALCKRTYYGIECSCLKCMTSSKPQPRGNHNVFGY